MITDDQDNCIGLAGAQADLDGDGIGNACDVTDTKDMRYCVWTFRPPDSSEAADIWTRSWDTTGTAWSTGVSSLTHIGGTTPEYAQLRDAYFTAPGGVAMDVHATVNGYDAPLSIGVELEGQAGGSFMCRLNQGAGGGKLELVIDGAVRDTYGYALPLPQQFDAYTRLAVIQQPGKTVVRCHVVVPNLPTIELVRDIIATSIMLRPRIFAANGNVFCDHVSIYKLGVN
jgi:hypothetical protein